MKFVETEIEGVYAIEISAHVDERGFFSRIFCPDEFQAAGIKFQSVQINLSRNLKAYTLRGMHFQEEPFAESKLVRAVTGSIFDVVVDLRENSGTYLKWVGRILDSEKGDALFVPEGCAHGFLTLENNTDVLYQMGRAFIPGKSKGLRYDDPKLSIKWPATPVSISKADLLWPLLD